jgi:26S proteasome regulatory subunit N3
VYTVPCPDRLTTTPTQHKHTTTDLKKNVALLERAVQTTQQRLVGRVLRNNTAFRRSLAPAALADALMQCLPADEPLRDQGLRVLAEVRIEMEREQSNIAFCCW